MTRSATLRVAGATIYYEVRASGPILLVFGSPMASPMFTPLADALADHYTVVTHDPRGISRSTIDDPNQDSTPELRADDVVALMDALGTEDADVFGTSGGAVTGLALVARHPRRVRTLIAHEPPVLELLPDAAVHRAGTEALIEIFHRDGVSAAWAAFMGTAGFDDDPEDMPPGMMEPTEQDIADGARFFGHELRWTTRYEPDIAALRDGPARVIVGVGVDSGDLLTYQTSAALAERLGTPMVTFPGDHGGFIGHPQAFAETLGEVLTASRTAASAGR